MDYFSICLKIQDKKCIVVGGGRVACRKVKTLLDCGARVAVISPDLTDCLQELHEEKKIHWLRKKYSTGDLADAFLVIAATDNPDVQAAIYAEAEKNNTLLNVADVPKWCNFILPATLNRGSFSIAISTGGKSPALARSIRERMEDDFGREYELYIEILGMLRPMVLDGQKTSQENKQTFSKLLHENFPGWIRNGNWAKIKEHILSVMGPDFDRNSLRAIKAQIDSG